MTKSYWQKRISESEQRAQSIASSMLAKEKREYERIYRRLNKEIHALYTKSAAGVSISRTELWRVGRSFELKELIQQEFGFLANKQDAAMFETLKNIYEETLETELTLITGAKPVFTEVHHLTMQAHINEVYKGSNFSSRIHKNTNELAARISSDMERLLTGGATPDDLMKQLQKDFNMGYNQSSRLVRTESSRVYNKAAAEGFKQAGVEQVEYDASKEACPVCQADHGKIFKLGQEPVLPRHPNCRCFYIPLIKVDE